MLVINVHDSIKWDAHLFSSRFVNLQHDSIWDFRVNWFWWTRIRWICRLFIAVSRIKLAVSSVFASQVPVACCTQP